MFKFPFFSARPDALTPLYGDIVARARLPRAYLEFGVRDDFEGRFERLCLITTLVLRRLRELPKPAAEIAQKLVDRLFADLDDGLRRAGIGDLSVPKRMKKLAQGFYGRAEAYTAALDGKDNQALRLALSRNLFSGGIAPDDIAPGQLAEIAALIVRLDQADCDALLAGGVLEKTPAPLAGPFEEMR